MKRICAMVLTLLMIIQIMGMTVSANPVGFPENKVVDKSEWINDDQLMVLSKVGFTPTWSKVSSIGSQGSRANEIVSRWFVAYYLDRLVKLDKSTSGEFEVLFKDLSSEHKHYKAIKGAVRGGYMKADPDGYFRPNEPVTARDAALALLKVIGYGQYMEVMGEARAFQITNIMDGIPDSDKITQTQMMRLIYNALNAPAMRAENYSFDGGGANVEYVIDENYLGFEHIYGVKHEVAILDGMNGSDLDEGKDFLNDGYITIDDVQYKYAEDVTALFGKKVDYFYKEASDGTRTILHLFASDDNKEFVLAHKDIDDFRDGVYYYADGNKTKTVELSPDVKVIFNGIANTNYDDAEMNPAFGKVTFINNDKDREYDVVKVDSYEFFYSSSIDTEKSVIYDNTGSKVRILDLSAVDEMKITSGDSVLTLNRLKNNNLLAVKRSSKHSGYEKVTIESFKVSRKSLRVSSVGEDFIVTSEGRFNLWEEIADSVEMGKTYNLFIYDDTVVMVTEDENVGPEYAYLVNAAVDGTAFSKYTRFAVVDLAGNYAEYEGAEKLTLDGETYDDPDSIRSALLDSAAVSEGRSEEYPFAQPIRIDFNTKGKVNFIDTYRHNEEIEDEKAIQKAPEAVDATNQYVSYNRTLYNLVPGTTNQYKELVTSVGTDTKILFVPGNRSDDQAYMKKSLTTGGKYRVDVLGRDPKSYVADVVMVYYETKEGTVDSGTRTTVISELTTEYDAVEGEIVYGFKGYYMATLKNYVCDEELYRQLSVGDVYKFEVGKNDKVTAYVKIYAIDDDFPGLADRESATSTTLAAVDSNGIVFGSLLHADDGFIRITQSLPTDPEGYDPTYKTSNVYIGSSTGILKYSVVRGVPTVEPVSISSAVSYTTNSENPAVLLVTVLNGASQIYFIEK